MPDLEAIEVLEQAKERLFEYGWTQGSFLGRDEDDTGVCLEEALVGKRGCFITSFEPDAVRRAEVYMSMAAQTGHGILWLWNDRQRSAAPVFAAIDQAIVLAKEEPYPA